jgi:hypothetical protein
MADILKTFADELRSHECGAEADVFESWLKQAGNDIHNRHTKQFLKALEWIVSRTEHSLVERVDQMARLTEFETPVVIGMRAFTGWR